ncbi:TPA: hypothetical protein N0F65_007799 [Lagenidium giganteum]|uniref:Uncharacterized protein n=1 Tax=Lagenidium giganteum TaxID=4803 RepID=A0AAV2Z2A1_9STRA|nr:TPA: hypothetical protein N0F65_007799 [Lagenidium giganteum]
MALTNESFAFINNVPIAATTVEFSPHYARQLQYDVLTTVEDEIVGIRRNPVERSFYLVTQYWWVDSERRWSMATTEKRAERCQKYADNGAMDLEKLLRNVDCGALLDATGARFPKAVYWRSYGITNDSHNRWYIGVDEKINIVDALGTRSRSSGRSWARTPPSEDAALSATRRSTSAHATSRRSK